jgi:hypothetical protein
MRLSGWRSFEALGDRPAGKKRGYGIAIGEEEGHRRGDIFVVEVPTAEGEMERVGFGRIIAVGPGGEAGVDDPSHFKLRAGKPAPGARLREWKQIGIRFGPHARWAFRYIKGDLDASFPGGVGLTLGYDMSPFVRAGDEFWLRLDAGYLDGAAEFGFSDFSFYADLLPEFHFYGSDRLAWVVTSGLGVLWLTGTYTQPDELGGTDSAKVSGPGLGVIVGGGLDVALHPDWNLQGLLKVRQGVHPVEPQARLNGQTVNLDVGFLGQIELGFTATYTF